MSSEFEFAPGEVKSVLTTIRAAAAVDGPCTLTYPQVHTLQKMLIALLPPVAEPPADANARLIEQAKELGEDWIKARLPQKKLPADAEVAQAERAVIEAAMKWKQGLSEAGKRELDEIIAAADRLDDARQRSAAAKEQG